MTDWEERNIAALRHCLKVAMFHQECLDSDCGESIKKEHASNIARKIRALNKAIKESTK